jgi:diguanylate cyclase (GGDEF)-like protein
MSHHAGAGPQQAASKRELAKLGAGRWRRPLLSALPLLAIGLAISTVVGVLWRSSAIAHERASFRAAVSYVSATLATELRRNNDFIATVKALVEMQPHLTATRFGEWYRALEGPQRETGSLATGVVSLVPARQLASFQARRMSDPAFLRFSGGTVGIDPPGRRRSYCLLSAGVSQIADDPLIQAATHADWCTSALPGTAKELQEETDAGRLLVAPPALGTVFVGAAVYRQGASVRTVAQRRAAVIGWVWTSIGASAAMQAALERHRGLRLTLLHRNPGGVTQLIGRAGAPGEGAEFSERISLPGEGGWVVAAQGTGLPTGGSADLQGMLAFLIGATISGLAFALVLVLIRSRQDALVLAERRTGELRHQALHDALTGLPNRVLALDRAQQMLARARRGGAPVAALCVDLDRFKQVNDTLGHAAGDALLQIAAQRLQSAIRGADSCARLGADEFVVLVEAAGMDAGPELVAERLLELLRVPYDIPAQLGRQLTVSASVGVAIGPRSSAEELLRDADVALNEAKAAGGNRYVLFESRMHTAVQDRMTLEMDLAEALEEQQLEIVYQPTFDLRTERTLGMEALLRWRHPTRGLVMPMDFISVAEQSGLIVPIGRWVLQRACEQAANWRGQGHAVGVAVNLSPVQIEMDGLVAEVHAALHCSGLDPGALTLEVTETAIMKDARVIASRLCALKALGVRIAIDDFGTGYSSLAYLRQFPVDALKIDRSFVASLASSQNAPALIHTLVRLGKMLQLQTIAEGIEDSRQLEALKREGCDCGQGFLYARPLRAEDLERFLQGPVAAGEISAALAPGESDRARPQNGFQPAKRV